MILVPPHHPAVRDARHREIVPEPAFCGAANWRAVRMQAAFVARSRLRSAPSVLRADYPCPHSKSAATLRKPRIDGELQSILAVDDALWQVPRLPLR